MLAAVSVNLMSVLPLFLTGAMAVQIGRDYGVNPAAIAILASGFALTSMLGSAPLGRVVRTLGIRRSLYVSSAVAVFAMIACAGSGSLPMLAAGLAIAGIGNALGQPAGNALVASQVSPKRYGFGFAIKQSAIPLATTLGGLAVPIIALTVGWRYAYFLGAFVAVAAMLLVPADKQRNVARTESTVPREYVSGLWLLAAGIAAVVLAVTGIGALGAAGGVHVGLSESAAGFVVAAGGVAGLAIRLSAGLYADRVQFDSLRGVAILSIVGAVGFAAMAFDVPLLYVIGLVVANAFGWGWPGLQHLSMARRFPTATAAASGISQTGIALGLLIGPLLLGVVATSVGWSATWLIASAAGVVGGAVVWLAARMIPEPQPAD